MVDAEQGVREAVDREAHDRQLEKQHERRARDGLWRRMLRATGHGLRRIGVGLVAGLEVREGDGVVEPQAVGLVGVGGRRPGV